MVSSDVISEMASSLERNSMGLPSLQNMRTLSDGTAPARVIPLAVLFASFLYYRGRDAVWHRYYPWMVEVGGWAMAAIGVVTFFSSLFNGFPSGSVFAGHAIEPVRLAETKVGRHTASLRLEPARTLPSAPIAEFGAERDKTLVQRGKAQSACGGEFVPRIPDGIV